MASCDACTIAAPLQEVQFCGLLGPVRGRVSRARSGCVFGVCLLTGGNNVSEA